MLKLIFNKKIRMSLISAITMFGVVFSVTAEPFNAYPGKYKATLVSVEAANIVYLSVDVWAGYPRNLRITLPNIAVPVDHPDAPACQAELVQKAVDFTNEFMTKAQFIEVKDLRMESTDQEDAITNIYTDQGSLASKLKEKGLARPASVEVTKPWC
jgi:hypothetical protein